MSRNSAPAYSASTSRNRQRVVVPALIALAATAFAQPRVVLVDIDGIRRDTFEKVYLSGRTPNLARILGEVRDGKGFGTAVWFENATSVFPSVTMAGQASIFTGAQPSGHGIPGNQWFDRIRGRTINYMGPTGLSCVYGFLPVGLGDCELGLANRHLQAPTLYEAATAAGKSSIVVFSQYWKGATHAVVPSVSEVTLLAQGSVVKFEQFDTTMMDHAIEALRAYGLPDILMVYFAGADGVGHELGTAGQVPYFEKVIDPQIGRLLDTLAAMDKAWRSTTQFVITSDHGRTDSPPAAEDTLIEPHMRKGLERLGYRPDQYRIIEDGGVVHLYLRSRAVGARWIVPPADADILAVAKELNGDTILDKVTESIVVRKNGPGSRYVASGEKPLTVENALLLAAMESPRTGDLLLLLKPGRYFANTAAKGAQHGSIYPPDCAVPIVLALGGANPGRSPAPISTTDIARIIATYLGFKMGANQP